MSGLSEIFRDIVGELFFSLPVLLNSTLDSVLILVQSIYTTLTTGLMIS
jgi:hypothetical protein